MGKKDPDTEYFLVFIRNVHKIILCFPANKYYARKKIVSSARNTRGHDDDYGKPVRSVRHSRYDRYPVKSPVAKMIHGPFFTGRNNTILYKSRILRNSEDWSWRRIAFWLSLLSCHYCIRVKCHQHC